MKTFFGFGIAPSMFPPNCFIRKAELGVDVAKVVIAGGVISCLNPSHKATIEVMKTRFDIDVEIPEKAPSIIVQVGDRLLVLTAGGLPRMENRHEYTVEEVKATKFSFTLFTVTE